MDKKVAVIVKAIIITGLLICFCSACGGKYDDVISVNEKFIDIMKTYSEDLKTADNAKDVAAAINEAAEGIEKLAPEMKELSEKYPELRTEKDLPEKLAQSEKEMEKVGEELAASFMTLAKYMGNQDVMAAQMRLGKAMQATAK